MSNFKLILPNRAEIVSICFIINVDKVILNYLARIHIEYFIDMVTPNIVYGC